MSTDREELRRPTLETRRDLASLPGAWIQDHNHTRSTGPSLTEVLHARLVADLPSLLDAVEELARVKAENAELRRLIENDHFEEWYAEAHAKVERLEDDNRALTAERDEARAKLAVRERRFAAVVNYCDEADASASRNMIGGVVLPWAGHIRYLIGNGGANCSVCESPDHSADWKHAESDSLTASIVPGLVERLQHAARQVDAALEDSRVSEGAAAWLRTIKATLIDGSGDMARAALASPADTPTNPEAGPRPRRCSVCGRTHDPIYEGCWSAAVLPVEAPTPASEQSLTEPATCARCGRVRSLKHMERLQDGIDAFRCAARETCKQARRRRPTRPKPTTEGDSK